MKLSADHWMIGGSMDVGTLLGERRIREGVDWPRFKALVTDPAGDWYHELAGRDAYEKLWDLWA